MSYGEDTVTDWIAEYLRKRGINCDVQRSTQLSDGTTVRPDYWVENHGVYLGEADWETKESEGWLQSYTYSQCPVAAGAFFILYPKKLKELLQQTTLTGTREPILSQYSYSVAFLRQGTKPDMAKVTLEQLPDWLFENIHSTREPQVDITRTVNTLRTTVRELEKELVEVSNLPDLFKSVVGSDLSEDEMRAATRGAAAYILMNQLTFYRILSKRRKDVPPINPDSLKHPRDLDDYYFAYILSRIDYEPVFAPQVASHFSVQSMGVLRNCIRVIYGLRPEFIDQDVLGKVFHTLIPYNLRKTLGAYYTLGEGADLLAGLAIEHAQDIVMDPACGSGTLLVAAFKRKKQLLTKTTFDESDYRDFMEEITGLDVMPFAAHLSTIHLTMQGIEFAVDRMRIAIEDSTNLEPGVVIPPLSEVLPIGQTTIEHFFAENLERDTLSPEGKPGEEMKLNHVDLVIMNPPFTRQQRVSGLGTDYKTELATRFKNYDQYMDKRMKYAGYFLFLADKFLKKGGRIGAVLPVSVLRGKNMELLREWLLENYDVEYIVIRNDKSNFSEETDLREILLVTRKGRSKSHVVSFIGIEDISKVEPDDIKRGSRRCKENEVFGGTHFTVRSIPQSNLSHENLFREVALQDYTLIQLWDDLSQNSTLTQFDTVFPKWSHRNAPTPRGTSYAKLTLNSPIEGASRSDKWVIEESHKNTIKIQHAKSSASLTIDKSSVTPALRRMTNRGEIDLSKIDEYVVQSQMENYEEFRMMAGLSRFNWDEWQQYLASRKANLFLVTRFNISAPGTRLLSYYSKTKRSASRAGFSVLPGLSNKHAKILCLWFNSTINILHTLLERAETEGAWMEVPKYAVDSMRVINPNEVDSSVFLALFKKVAKIKHPPIWQQLAMNTQTSDYSDEDLLVIENVYPDVHDYIGKRFDIRKKLDLVVLESLDIKLSGENILAKLYPSLLKEITILKRMMTV